MSLPFTSPANATWQTLLDEITLAYSERRQVRGQAVYTPTDDKDVQAYTYWETLQEWIEDECIYFINHVSGPFVTADKYAFLDFTLATFRSAASLNENGFRRVPADVGWDGISDPVWQYGFMQAGDIIGPWIFEDLQKAFSALRWTMLDFSYPSIYSGPGSCSMPLTYYYNDYSPDRILPATVDGVRMDEDMFYVALPFGMDLYTGKTSAGDYHSGWGTVDDYFMILSESFNATSWCSSWDDTYHCGDRVGKRKYLPEKAIHFYDKGTALTFNIVDCLGGYINSKFNCLSKWDFTNQN